MPQGGQPHVVVIGGGFAGLNAARTLGESPARVTLIDRRNYHLFFPLLYQVATAGLSPGDISAPIRWVLRRQRNTTVLLADVSRIEPEKAAVILADGESIGYDYLIVAAGSIPSYFGRSEWARHAPPLLSMEDALEVRRRLLLAWESAEREAEPAARAPWLSIIVVGGGPTGVEMAGAIAEMARHALAGDFRRIDPRATRVLLLEGSDRVLPAYPPDLSAKAQASLRRLGVEVRTGARVTELDDRGVSLGDERIESRCVMWAAGVAASGLGATLGAVDRAGRVLVAPDLSVPGHPEIFVAGDLAAIRSGDTQVPAVAPAAIQAGRCAALNVLLASRGEKTKPFRYSDHGTLATIGRASAVADFGRIRLSGFAAWLAWIVIHIYFLIGFRNRLMVMFGWAWAYLTYQRGVRLVTRYPDEAKRTGVKMLLLISLAVAFSGGGPSASVVQAAPTPLERRMLYLINGERSARGLEILAWDRTLAQLARVHADDMKEAGRISHQSSAGGGDFTVRLSRTTFRASAAAENVAFSVDVEQAHRGLMASPGHRANILNKDLTAAGIGIVADKDGAIYVVEDFAAPIVSVTDEEAALRLVAVLESARARLAGRPLPRDERLSHLLASYLEELVAADSVTIGDPPPYGAGWLFTYTTTDPSKIPDTARGKLGRAEGFALAVSYRKTRAYPFGTYWVVLCLSGSGPSAPAR